MTGHDWDDTSDATSSPNDEDNGNQRSEERSPARPWTREEMDDAEPYPLPEVPDDTSEDPNDTS